VIRFLIIILITQGFSVFAQNDIQLILKAKYSISNKEFVKAQTILDSVETKNYYVNYLLGESYFLQQKYDSAIVCYYNSNLRKEGFSKLRLADSYALIGEYKKASTYLKEYLKAEDKDFSNLIINRPSFEEFKNNTEWEKLNVNQYYSQEEKSFELFPSLPSQCPSPHPPRCPSCSWRRPLSIHAPSAASFPSG